MGAALHPAHGAFLLNLHSADHATAATFKHALLGGSSSSGHGSNSSGVGAAFSVGVLRQRNTCLVAARGLTLPVGGTAACKLLRQAAATVASQHGFSFPAGSRACHRFQVL